MATINGTSGNDSLLGTASFDFIYGFEGDDTLNGGTGDDYLEGGLGNDTYIVDSPIHFASEIAGGGTDSYQSSVVSLKMDPNIENLIMNIGAINATGNDIANFMMGNDAANNIQGGGGNDEIYGFSGNDTLDGGTGDDGLYGREDNDFLKGGAGNDFLMGGSEVVSDLTGNDTLDGGSGNDTMYGQDGDDTYYVDNSFDSVIEEINGGYDTINSSISYTLGANVENLTLTGTSAIDGIGNIAQNTIFGNGNNNFLSGGEGSDELFGQAGNDFMTGGSEHDGLYGGDGNDTLDGGIGGGDEMLGGRGNDLYFVDALDYIEELDGNGIDTVNSSVSYTLGDKLENLTLTGFSAINGTGNVLNNTIMGNDANNTIVGKAGNDDLYGFFGNDTLDGGIGNDSLYGLEDNDLIKGGDGNDTLGGGTGSDTMYGQNGNDLYLVENPLDSVIEGVNGGIDAVTSAITYTLGVNVEQLNLVSQTAINGTGNSLNNALTGNGASNSLNGDAGNDTLLGGGGIDTLIGGIGDDSLTGGAAADRLTGGTGKDRFVFTAKTEGKDTITDFSLIDDTINVSKLGFGGGLTANAAITAAQFRLGSAAGDSSDRFIYNKTSGALLFDADGTGASAQVQFAQLSTGLAMTNNDIFVIA